MSEQAKNNRALLLFVLVIPVLTELLSGNTPMTLFMNPVVYGFLIVAYSIPALLIRELYIHRHMGIFGLFLLGLAYGVFNEGVAARTILQTGEMLSFHNYSTLGFNVPWALLIIPWHAFFAIIYPITIIHAIYPEQAKQSWLSQRAMFALGAVSVILGSFAYFSTDKFPATSSDYLLVCWGLVGFLTLLALKVPQGPLLTTEECVVISPRKKYILVGVLFGVIQMLSFIWGELRLPVFAHLFLVGVPFFVLVHALKKKTFVDSRTLSFLAIGHYTPWALLMTVVIGITGGTIVVFGMVLVWALLFALLRKVGQQNSLKPE
jgi:hypothetical protein